MRALSQGEGWPAARGRLGRRPELEPRRLRLRARSGPPPWTRADRVDGVRAVIRAPNPFETSNGATPVCASSRQSITALTPSAEEVVCLDEEARLPVIAALHDVQRVAGNGEAGGGGTWQTRGAPTLSALPMFRRSAGWTKAGYYSSDPMKRRVSLSPARAGHAFACGSGRR